MTDQSSNQNDSTSQSKPGTSPILVIGIFVLIGLLLAVIVLALIGFGDSEAEPPEVIVPTPIPNSPVATALEAVNVRSGPGTNYPSYGVAPEGKQGEVIGVSPDGGWWVIRISTEYASSGQGWVSGDYVRVENAENVPVFQPPAPPPEINPPTPIPDEGQPIATALDYINVRSGPGFEYEIYGVGAKGAQALVIGISEDSEWWVVEISTIYSPDGTGWVSADWVVVENGDDVPVIPAPPLP
jgi:uncharacterized protein YraI